MTRKSFSIPQTSFRWYMTGLARLLTIKWVFAFGAQETVLKWLSWLSSLCRGFTIYIQRMVQHIHLFGSFQMTTKKLRSIFSLLFFATILQTEASVQRIPPLILTIFSVFPDRRLRLTKYSCLSQFNSISITISNDAVYQLKLLNAHRLHQAKNSLITLCNCKQMCNSFWMN